MRIKKANIKTTSYNNLGFGNTEIAKSFSQLAKKFNSSISICLKDSCQVDCKNPIQLLFLGNKPGDPLYIYAEGEDAKDAIDTLNEYLISITPKFFIKVLFLDMDGVLNSKQDEYDVDLRTSKHLELLQKIILTTDAKIVLSSSWRKDIPLLQEVLIPKLKEYNLKLLDRTPYMYNLPRGDEIREWIRTTKYGISQFAILDDNDDMMDLSTNLIQTNTNIGLQEEDSIKCINLLNTPSHIQLMRKEEGKYGS